MAKYVISTIFPQINYHVDANVDTLNMGNFTLTSVQLTPPPALVINDVASQVNIVKQVAEPVPSPFCVQEQVPFQVQQNMLLANNPNVSIAENPMFVMNQNPQQTVISRGMNVAQSTISLNNHSHIIALT